MPSQAQHEKLNSTALHYAPHRRQRGISMVEILVALLLSMVLTLIVSQVYLGNKQSYRLQEAQSRLQENGRFVLELLAKDIRRAGNMGCPSVKKTPVVMANPTPTITPDTSLMGYNANSSISSYPVSDQTYDKTNWTPNAPDIGITASGKMNAIAGTDMFTIQFAEPCGGRLQTKVAGMQGSPSLTLPSTNTCSVQAVSDELVMSDCGQVEVFRADTANNTVITITSTANNIADHFTYTHDVDAEVMLFHSHTYFIRMFNTEPTLYRRENTEITPTPQPIMEGVENMQVLYGVDVNPVDGSVDGYYRADQVDANKWWANIIAVRIDLVLRSSGVDGANLTTSTTQACNGVTVTDRRLRRCYSFTINLRNPRA
jgi:type IV pilus assembly protein PilW